MMNRTRTIRRGVVAALCAMAAAFSAAQASDSSGTASAAILSSLSISRNSDTNWGRVLAPSSGTATYYLDYSSGSTSVSSGSGYCFSDGNAGDYTVSGAQYASVSYSVSVGSFNGSGVSISTMYINGSGGSGTGQLDGSGNLNLRLGGYLDVQAGASIMTQTASITVNVDYQ